MSKVFNTKSLREYRNNFVHTIIHVVYGLEKPDLRDVKSYIMECIGWYEEVLLKEGVDLTTPEDDALEAISHWDYCLK